MLCWDLSCSVGVFATGGFRDMYLAKNNRMFYALLIAISVQSVGVFALIQAGLLTYEAGAFPWLGTVIGGYIFGLGIVRRVDVPPGPGIARVRD
ncbi:YeeE/YedE thiosulfate transporter family protein [Escherichia coli]